MNYVTRIGIMLVALFILAFSFMANAPEVAAQTPAPDWCDSQGGYLKNVHTTSEYFWIGSQQYIQHNVRCLYYPDVPRPGLTKGQFCASINTHMVYDRVNTQQDGEIACWYINGVFPYP